MCCSLSEKTRIKVVFIGHEKRILSYLIEQQERLNIELVAIYVFKPSLKIRNFRRWLGQYKYWRNLIRSIKRIYPNLNKKWWRHFALYDIEDSAIAHKIHCVKSASVNNSNMQQLLHQRKVDVGIVANFEQRLNKHLLKIPPMGFINFHPGKLPEYKGRKPIQAAIKNNENQITICWHTMTEKIDQGKVILSKEIITKEKSEKALLDQSVSVASDLLAEVLLNMQNSEDKAYTLKQNRK